MSMTCLNCKDFDCEWKHTDKPACEDYIPPSRLEDDEPPEKPVDPVANLLAGLRSEVDDLTAQVKSLQRQVDDFFAAVVKLREGEE